MKKLILAIVVALIGTILIKVLECIFGTSNVFVFAFILVFIIGICLPVYQWVKE